MTTNQSIEDFSITAAETLSDSLEALGMSQDDLAIRTGLDKKTISMVISGAEPITHKTATALERALHVPAHFWLNMATV